MRFEPLKEEDLISLIPDGTYAFEVLEAQDATSRNGNEMIKLKLGIEYNGKQRIVFDYLLEVMRFKLIHFCESTNLTHKYDNGTLTASDCEGKKGRVSIITEEQPGFAKQNKVSDYIGTKAAKAVNGSKPAGIGAPKVEEDTFQDQDIPF